jgi:hypothetical protein
VTIHTNARPLWFRNWNEYNLNLLTRIHWRASLVPAAAVIPAPIAYIKVVAVKKLVVECGVSVLGVCGGCCVGFTACAVCSRGAHLAHCRRVFLRGSSFWRLECGISAGVTSLWCLLKHSYYCEKIRVFQAVIF